METKKIFKNISDFFYYDMWCPISDKWYNVKWFFRNLKTFWQTLWHFRSWDYSYVRDLYIIGLKQLKHSIETGIEEYTARTKKAEKIQELIELLEIDVDKQAWHYAESQEPFSMKIYEDTYEKIKKERNTRIAEILNGQDDRWLQEQYNKEKEKLKTEHPELYNENEYHYDLWVKTFDGTGVEGWWD